MPMEESRQGAPRLVLTEEILARAAEIAQTVGRLTGEKYLEKHPGLEKNHAEEAVQGSLQYEDNHLTLEQVLALSRETEERELTRPEREVKNALNAYALLDTFDPAEPEALKRMHHVLMDGLMAETGQFRAGNVGVYQGNMLIHQGAPAREVERLIRDLCAWLRDTSAHPLIRACAFHYELELIHPFTDGNGPLGRLCQTAILAKWHPVFRIAPVEALLSHRRQGYFNAFIRAENAEECGEFVLFMLEVIGDALAELLRAGQEEITGKKAASLSGRKKAAAADASGAARTAAQEKLLGMLRSSPDCTQEELASYMEKSPRTVRAMMRSLQESGVLLREGARKNGHWVINAQAVGE